jgi:hypothetical protein
MAKTIYISGKIGRKRLSKAAAEKFMKAQEKLLNEGWNVVNQASPDMQKDAQKHVDIEEKKWLNLNFGRFDRCAWTMLWNMHFLALCDAIYMMKGWEDSPCAAAELAYAKACGKEIVYEEEPRKP